MTTKTIEDFLINKSDVTLKLFKHFINAYEKIGSITLQPTKSMIGVANADKRIAWITQFGKNFIHVVFPFKKPYPDNLCFIKIAQVPGYDHQFNHHFRMYFIEDVNEEVINFMKIANENA